MDDAMTELARPTGPACTTPTGAATPSATPNAPKISSFELMVIAILHYLYDSTKADLRRPPSPSPFDDGEALCPSCPAEKKSAELSYEIRAKYVLPLSSRISQYG
jgi:hypothetical protein